MSQPVTFQLTETDQQLLLQIARNAVRSYLSGSAPALRHIEDGPLADVRGVFVSIHEGHELRGCIGNIHAVSPIYRSVAECAIAAAVGDPRFMPLTTSELTAVTFEISVLSSFEPLRRVSDLEIGKHGLLITKQRAKGLLLPQVAAQYGWTAERFLQETCRKAGLRPDDWKQDATIELFSAFVFNETQFQIPSAS
jgi:AmmeMemoRadiSam system protein A